LHILDLSSLRPSQGSQELEKIIQQQIGHASRGQNDNFRLKDTVSASQEPEIIINVTNSAWKPSSPTPPPPGTSPLPTININSLDELPESFFRVDSTTVIKNSLIEFFYGLAHLSNRVANSLKHASINDEAVD